MIRLISLEKCWKKISAFLLVFTMMLSVTACGSTQTENSTITEDEFKAGEKEMVFKINDEIISVAWENNESVKELMEIVSSEPLTIQMSMYGGFEQVGALGKSLPRDDVQMTTDAGDIVLYSGNQMVIFYGSNTWAYTRLGKVRDKTASELAELLGNGDVEITICMPDSSSVIGFDFEKQTVMLNSGYEMPIIGLGTWTLSDDEAENSVYIWRGVLCG